MVKKKSTKRIAPAAMSEKELRLRVDRRRIERELALQRRIAKLSRELHGAAMRTDEQLLSLGRTLVTAQGWAVVTGSHAQGQVETIERLSARVVELEEQLEEARAAAGAAV